MLEICLIAQVNRNSTTNLGEFGTVESANIISDRNTGRSKGFGFVEMASDSEAQAAIEGLNGTDYEGRPMKGQ